MIQQPLIRKLGAVWGVGGVVLIITVSYVSQPWRGIIDAGVVLGLACGMGYLLFYSLKAARIHTFVADPEAITSTKGVQS